MLSLELREHLRGNGIVPILSLDDPSKAVETALALVAGGLDIVEVTLRSSRSMEVLRAVRAALPRAVVAAGTVISVEQVRAVKETGVDFVVCPGIDHELVRASQQANLPVIPGVLTPTDVLRALGAGIDTVKVFPVGEVGGPAWIRALSAPFPHLHFVPTGGIRGPDVEAYLSLPSVLAVGGSWLVPPRGSAATPDEISAAARQAWDDAARARRGDS